MPSPFCRSIFDMRMLYSYILLYCSIILFYYETLIYAIRLHTDVLMRLSSKCSVTVNPYLDVVRTSSVVKQRSLARGDAPCRWGGPGPRAGAECHIVRVLTPFPRVDHEVAETWTRWHQWVGLGFDRGGLDDRHQHSFGWIVAKNHLRRIIAFCHRGKSVFPSSLNKTEVNSALQKKYWNKIPLLTGWLKVNSSKIHAQGKVFSIHTRRIAEYSW